MWDVGENMQEDSEDTNLATSLVAWIPFFRILSNDNQLHTYTIEAINTGVTADMWWVALPCHGLPAHDRIGEMMILAVAAAQKEVTAQFRALVCPSRWRWAQIEVRTIRMDLSSRKLVAYKLTILPSTRLIHPDCAWCIAQVVMFQRMRMKASIH